MPVELKLCISSGDRYGSELLYVRIDFLRCNLKRITSETDKDSYMVLIVWNGFPLSVRLFLG